MYICVYMWKPEVNIDYLLLILHRILSTDPQLTDPSSSKNTFVSARIIGTLLFTQVLACTLYQLSHFPVIEVSYKDKYISII